MQRIGPNTWARSSGGGEQACFRVVSAAIGDPTYKTVRVCFNVEPDEATCATPDFDFDNLDNPNLNEVSDATALAGPCIEYEWDSSTEYNSSGPLDSIQMSYTPGTCHKEGDSDPDCLLAAITGRHVTNNIWGPSTTRVGDLADNIVVVTFPTAPAFIGTRWQIHVQGVEQTGMTSLIVGNAIQFTLPADVNAGETVVISHENTSGDVGSCTSVDGRTCWRFYDMPVHNAVGVSFWILEDTGPWLLNAKTGQWELG
jgi:hypothetical protein